ncbi:hypothetical protein CB1_001502001 [Camelus ferus]|nr:hypothetical protein CB1_001502001 [Camelus ferus]
MSLSREPDCDQVSFSGAESDVPVVCRAGTSRAEPPLRPYSAAAAPRPGGCFIAPPHAAQSAGNIWFCGTLVPPPLPCALGAFVRLTLLAEISPAGAEMILDDMNDPPVPITLRSTCTPSPATTVISAGRKQAVCLDAFYTSSVFP